MNMKQSESIHEHLNEIVRRIVKTAQPQKIILFGSHARGTAGPHSDVDILVIMDLKKSRREQATEIDLALYGIDLPTDIIVVTGEEFERGRNHLGTIIRPVSLEGKILYEKAA